MVGVWLAAAAGAQVSGDDSRAQLYDALLRESQGDLEGATTRYDQLSRTLSASDPMHAEALYWLGHARWSEGNHLEARKALTDGIRGGDCPQCRDLLEVIEMDAVSVHALPLRVDFEQGNHVLFHPWRVQPLGRIGVAIGPRGDVALEWVTAVRSADSRGPLGPDRLVLGLKQPTPAPRTFAFDVLSTRLDAWLDVVAVDDRGRTFSLHEPAPVPRGRQHRVVVPLEHLIAADGGAPLRPADLVLLSIVDRTGARASGDNQLWIDDLTVE